MTAAVLREACRRGLLEKTMLETLKDLLVGVRRTSTVTKAELLIVKT